MTSPKHAQATHVTLALTHSNDFIEIVVADDGVGFDPSRLRGAQSGFGLYSVRERLGLIGGRLEVTSEPGAGTRATIRAPGER